MRCTCLRPGGKRLSSYIDRPGPPRQYPSNRVAGWGSSGSGSGGVGGGGVGASCRRRRGCWRAHQGRWARTGAPVQQQPRLCRPLGQGAPQSAHQRRCVARLARAAAILPDRLQHRRRRRRRATTVFAPAARRARAARRRTRAKAVAETRRCVVVHGSKAHAAHCKKIEFLVELIGCWGLALAG